MQGIFLKMMMMMYAEIFVVYFSKKNTQVQMKI